MDHQPVSNFSEFISGQELSVYHNALLLWLAQTFHKDKADSCHGQEGQVFMFADYHASSLGVRSIKCFSTYLTLWPLGHTLNIISLFVIMDLPFHVSSDIWKRGEDKASIPNKSIQDDTWTFTCVDQMVYAFFNHCHLSFLISIYPIKQLTYEVY